MQRRHFLTSTGALVLAPALAAPPAVAQVPARLVRLGWLTAQTAASLAPSIAVVKAGLADLGYVEGRNLAIEFRYGDGAVERVAGLAAELERLQVDLILAQGAAVPVTRKLALKTPVVYVFSGDPVLAGLADSLAQPGGNMTGLTFMAAELNAKRLEMLREISPRLRQVAVIGNPDHPGAPVERAHAEQAGRQLGLSLRYFPTATRAELDTALDRLAASPPEAISLFADGFAIEHRQRIIDFGLTHRAPVVCGWPVFARSGALFTYGPKLDDSYRRLAYYADRIVKGAKPADLPIERPTTFELVVNLKTAALLGLTVPPSVRLRADDVIE